MDSGGRQNSGPCGIARPGYLFESGIRNKEEQIGALAPKTDVNLAKPGLRHLMHSKCGILCAELSVKTLSVQIPGNKKHTGLLWRLSREYKLWQNKAH